MQRFTNKVAIVTGAAQGIGQAIAVRLASEGAAVLLADVDATLAQRSADAIVESGGKAHGFCVDVSKQAQVQAMVDKAVQLWGRLDVLVANAGVTDREPFLQMSDELWHRVLEINLTGTFYCGQAAARQMVAQGEGGRIVNIASNSGVFGGRGRASYGASKAGIINLTQTMAIELSEHDILVNAVAPGGTRTRAVSNDGPTPSIAARAPMARLAEPEEIAAMVAFAASQECSFTTGHLLCVDGGFTVAGVMEG